MPKWILRLGRVTQKSSGLVDLLLLLLQRSRAEDLRNKEWKKRRGQYLVMAEALG